MRRDLEQILIEQNQVRELADVYLALNDYKSRRHPPRLAARPSSAIS
jgi:hypothetical protein